jgi:tRNA dimethylallyltransferase
MHMEKPKILVIVGPTASGKTSLSIKRAKEHDGEIVSADSRQVYKGLDLGTGKVTIEEMQGIPHHLLDVADPRETYTAADFVRDGREAIANILSRGKLPIIVGGTFFYVDALLGRIVAPQVPPDPVLRSELEKLTTSELFSRLQAADPRRAREIDPHNPHRLVRALEIATALGTVPLFVSEELYDARILGITIDMETLHKNIHDRLLARLEAGMVEEVRILHENGLSYERMEGLGLEYRYITRYLKGELSYEEMVATLETKIRQFAKRQMTWLKRDTSIEWI